MNHSSSYPPL